MNAEASTSKWATLSLNNDVINVPTKLTEINLHEKNLLIKEVTVIQKLLPIFTKSDIYDRLLLDKSENRKINVLTRCIQIASSHMDISDRVFNVLSNWHSPLCNDPFSYIDYENKSLNEIIEDEVQFLCSLFPYKSREYFIDKFRFCRRPKAAERKSLYLYNKLSKNYNEKNISVSSTNQYHSDSSSEDEILSDDNMVSPLQSKVKKRGRDCNRDMYSVRKKGKYNNKLHDDSGKQKSPLSTNHGSKFKDKYRIANGDRSNSHKNKSRQQHIKKNSQIKEKHSQNSASHIPDFSQPSTSKVGLVNDLSQPSTSEVGVPNDLSQPSTGKAGVVNDLSQPSNSEAGVPNDLSQPSTSKAGLLNNKKKSEQELKNNINRIDRLAQHHINMLKDMFTDADPDYIKTRVYEINGDKKKFADIVLEFSEKNDYPKYEEYVSRQRQLENRKKFIEGMSIEEFLEYFENPKETFSDVTKIMSDHYKVCAKNQLERDFPKHLSKTIAETLLQFNFHYFPSYKGLKRRKPHRKTQRSLKEQPLEDLDDAFLKEYFYVRMEKDIKKYQKNKQEEKKLKFEEAKKNGNLLECDICCDEEILVEDMSPCSSENDSHLFCNTCIKRYVESEIGKGKLYFLCLKGFCQSNFSLNVLKKVLKSSIFSNLLKRQQADEIAQAGIGDLVCCPFCDFATIMPNTDDKVFKCLNPECFKDSCRDCKELNHLPLKCNELVEKKKTDYRTYLEDEMAKAIIRRCYKCKKPYTKTSGCNKIVCSCGAKMCYICQKPIRGYEHFGSRKNGKCPMNSEPDLHLNEVMARVEELNRNRDPNIPLENDPTNHLPENDFYEYENGDDNDDDSMYDDDSMFDDDSMYDDDIEYSDGCYDYGNESDEFLTFDDYFDRHCQSSSPIYSSAGSDIQEIIADFADATDDDIIIDQEYHHSFERPDPIELELDNADGPYGEVNEYTILSDDDDEDYHGLMAEPEEFEDYHGMQSDPEEIEDYYEIQADPEELEDYPIMQADPEEFEDYL